MSEYTQYLLETIDPSIRHIQTNNTMRNFNGRAAATTSSREELYTLDNISDNTENNVILDDMTSDVSDRNIMDKIFSQTMGSYKIPHKPKNGEFTDVGLCGQLQ